MDNHSFVILCIPYTTLVCCSERSRAPVRVPAAGGHTRKQQRHTDINAKRHHAPSRRHASVISFNGAQRTSFVSHSQRRNVRGFCWWYVATIGLLTIGKSHYSNAPAAKCFALLKCGRNHVNYMYMYMYIYITLFNEMQFHYIFTWILSSNR